LMDFFIISANQGTVYLCRLHIGVCGVIVLVAKHEYWLIRFLQMGLIGC
jgi:hypothetical protein